MCLSVKSAVPSLLTQAETTRGSGVLPYIDSGRYFITGMRKVILPTDLHGCPDFLGYG